VGEWGMADDFPVDAIMLSGLRAVEEIWTARSWFEIGKYANLC
jgi:hypothetical protein